MQEVSESFLKLKSDFVALELLQNPVSDHNLLEYDFDVQKNYILLLCIFSNYCPEFSFYQNNFIKRIIFGLNNSHDLDLIHRESMSISDEFCSQIVLMFSQINLKYNLIVDLLILLSLSKNKSRDQIEFISETALVLNISENEVSTCTDITKLILKKDLSQITSLINTNNNLLENFVFYIKSFYEGILSFNQNLIYCYSNNYANFSSLDFKKNDAEKIAKTSSFENIQLSFKNNLHNTLRNTLNLKSKKIILKKYMLNSDDLQILISNSNEVIFYNCIFKNVSNVPIVFENCKKIIFHNCIFKNFTCKAISLSNSKLLKFHRCSFLSFDFHCIFDFEDLSNLYIENCNFSKISFKQLSQSMISISKFWPTNIIILKNKFKKCTNLSSYGALLLYCNKQFDTNTTLKVCENKFLDCQASCIVKCDPSNNFLFKDNIINNQTIFFNPNK